MCEPTCRRPNNPTKNVGESQPGILMGNPVAFTPHGEGGGGGGGGGSDNTQERGPTTQPPPPAPP
eukprot:COSAG01_NODE_5779_length_4036_cov_256.771654_1_plen_65_part_00